MKFIIKSNEHTHPLSQFKVEVTKMEASVKRIAQNILDKLC